MENACTKCTKWNMRIKIQRNRKYENKNII